MKDLRCNACGRLLARMQGEAIIAVKCPRCKTLNQFNNATSVKPDRQQTDLLENACVTT
jgi:phage FluMu protein Com